MNTENSNKNVGSSENQIEIFTERINLINKHLDDNKNNDAFFGSIKFVVKLGDQAENQTRNYLEYTDVSDKLYQPVKRENKIRVVKISKSGVQVSGF